MKAKNETAQLKMALGPNETLTIDPDVQRILDLEINPNEIALKVCVPLDGFCQHCGHAGGPTSCYPTDGCIAVSSDTGHPIENWGFAKDGEWRQNFDERGNNLQVPTLCVDRYYAVCFQHVSEYPSLFSKSSRIMVSASSAFASTAIGLAALALFSVNLYVQ